MRVNFIVTDMEHNTTQRVRTSDHNSRGIAILYVRQIANFCSSMYTVVVVNGSLVVVVPSVVVVVVDCKFVVVVVSKMKPPQ